MAVHITDDTADDDAVRVPTDIGGGKSDLDLLFEEVVSEAAPPVRLYHPKKDSCILEFAREIPASVLEGARRAAMKGRPRNADPNGAVLAGFIVSSQLTGILLNGEYLEDDHGNRLTFQTREFVERLGVSSRVEAASKFCGGDGFLSAISGQLLSEAGYDAQLEEADKKSPTVSG